MERYDWERGRGYGGSPGFPYDRELGLRGGWRGGGRPGPWGGYSVGGPWPVPYGYGPDYERGGYGRDYGREYGRGRYGWGPPADVYPYPEPGVRYRGWGRFGRSWPGEAGPPGGYGAEWGAAYSGRPYQEPTPTWRRGFDEFAGGWGYGGGRRSSQRYGYGGAFTRGPDFGPEYREDFDDDFEDDFDDFEDDFDEDFDADFDADLGPWDGGWEEEPDDAEVKRRVIRSLQDDGFIEAAAIQVEVKDRVVTLRGEVQDYMEARYAWDDAWDAPGVRGVISKLTVQGVGREESPPGAARKESGGATAGPPPAR